MSTQAPLAGLRVLDLSRILAGPWCSQLLADLGAAVIKVEKPGSGDDTRRWGPPWLNGERGETTGESAYYLSCNRGKRSLALDFTHPQGRELLLELATRADVLIENYKVGDLARHGLDFASMRRRQPRLVYCSISGFGQDGPYAGRSGYDAAIQALGGLMSLTGESHGPPLKVGVAVSDLMAGMYAATSILAALRRRDDSGEGCHIDLALLDTQVAWLANQASNYLIGGVAPQRHGSAHPNIVPYQTFACADGHLMLAVGNDAQFSRFARLVGRPQWSDDPRFATNPARVQHRELLLPQIAAALAARGRDAWLGALADAGVPAAPVNDLAEVFADPQVRARGLRMQAHNADAQALPMVRQPVRFDGSAPTAASPPPRLGQHSAEILAEIGIDAAAFEALRAVGAVA